MQVLWTALHQAAFNGQHLRAQALLQQDPDLDLNALTQVQTISPILLLFSYPLLTLG
jgi:ankyrin repeat protein